MNDPRLLVPIHVEALAVGESSTGGQWVNLKPDFQGIWRGDRVLGQQLEKPELSPSQGLHKPGVHLHWALPDGLTHGVADNESGVPEFPHIPNRWLVVRFWDQADPGQPLELSSRAWIIESDTITGDPNANVWPTLDSGVLKKAEDYSVFVGRTFELSRWPGESSAPRMRITAVGYGDSAFAAYYPACKGILGFHDQDFAGVRGDADLSYLVVGWYSNPSEDPLRQSLADGSSGGAAVALETFLDKERWICPGLLLVWEKASRARELGDHLQEAREQLARLQDSARKNDMRRAIAELRDNIAKTREEHDALRIEIAGLEKALPSGILCHGMVGGVKWSGTVESGVPLGRPFRIAVADTAVEALAALFGQEFEGDLANLARLLALFQYDLLTELEKPGGDSTVEAKVHERSFRPFVRGVRWDLMQEDRPAFGGSPEDRSPPIPGEIRLMLERLNIRQRRINQFKRERDSLRSEIYATWYKTVLNQAEGRADQREREDRLTRRMTGLRQEVAALSDEITGLEKMQEKGLPAGSDGDRIQEALEAFLPGWRLKRFDEPEFHRPNDPVVLLAGDAFRRSPRHGGDGRFRSDGRLLCRLSGEEIAGIRVTVPFAKIKDLEFGPSEIDAQWANPFGSIREGTVPSEAGDLFREALLLSLDFKRALHIMTTVYEQNDPGRDHTRESASLAHLLIDFYLEQVWSEARNPEIETPRLRWEREQTAWELVGRFPSPVMVNTWKGNPWLPLFLQWQVGWAPDSADTRHALHEWDLVGCDYVWKAREDGSHEKKVTYSGTTILTPSAGLHLSERLRQVNLAHDDRSLQTLQTAIHSMSLLCQSLGGFTDQLLMRRSHLELRPLEPGKGEEGPQFSPVYDAVRDVDWLAPSMGGGFFPVRAGRLKLEKLWIIDAFGQFLKLEEEDRVNGLRTVSAQRLRGSDGMVRLQPRLAQPARLSIQWLPAERWGAAAAADDELGENEELSPVCGWILPNFLDKALMIYDAGGYALGALQGVQKKSWREGVGASRDPIESFHWVDIPGSDRFFFGRPGKKIEDPLAEHANANPHLRAFLKGLLSMEEGSGKRFSDLLERMNEALSCRLAAGSTQNANLALLIGKPLALVRASIRLEVDGRPASAQGWEDPQGGPTGGIESLELPLRLGDRRKWNGLWLGDDGLMGFFLNQDYTRFYPAWGLEGLSDDYSRYRFAPLVSMAQPLDLTLLMDPTAGVCATSGILPRTRFSMPHGDITETLETRQVVFFSGPIVTPESDREIRMPQPSDLYGQWSWTHHPDVRVWREEPIVDVQKEQGRFHDPPPRIAEGWLKLVTAPLSIRVFTVKGKNRVEEEGRQAGAETENTAPDRFDVAPGDSITLSWSVTGAEEIELKDEKSILFMTRRHPLPTQYSMQVEGDTLLTLAARGREEKAAGEKEPRPAARSKSIKIVVERPEKAPEA
jgi:hypothetical protein